MGYKAAVQVLKKADVLKVKVGIRQIDLLNDLQAWTDQQQLQTIYHQVLVLDLEYALDKKVEQDLWTLGFKNHIAMLQEQTRDKKNARRSETQALLSWCLEAASGFYLTLLQELCSTYDLDLPFLKKGAVFGKLKSGSVSEPSTSPRSSSCLYICQYCLVHLGDIARYRNQRKQAESFYKHAVLVSPNSGHPYNQLALLEASQGDKLSTVFHYVRGIALKNPFPGAATNLGNTLSAAIDKDDPLTEIQSKMSVNEFVSLFLKVHGLLHNDMDLQQADLGVKSITATLTALVATQSFTAEKLIQMTVVNLYALRHTVGEKVMKMDELTMDEKRVRGLILDLLASSLSAFLLPVYTMKGDESLLDYYALPAIQLILMWIKNEPSVLTDPVFTNRLQIWPGYCRLLNSLQGHIPQDDYKKYEKVPLSYDRELQGFIGLKDVFKTYDFATENVDDDKEKYIRANRLIEIGKWLATYDVNDNKLMICSPNIENPKMSTFEPGCIQPDPTDKLLEEMKSFKVADDLLKLKIPEKRGGILKPQGSLEKSREERVQVKLSSNEEVSTVTPNTKINTNKLKCLTQNVALQSIYKRIEENKQVKFSAETNDREDKLAPKQKPPIQRQQAINPPPNANAAYRTQTFNQNHPALGNIPLDQSKDIFNLPFPKPPEPRGMPYKPNEMHHGVNHAPLPMPPSQYAMFANLQQQQSPGTPFAPLIEKPVTYNMPPPPYNYKKEEQQPQQRPQSSGNNAWWPSAPNFQQQDYYRYQQQQQQYGGGSSSSADLFNSPWSTVSRNAPPPQQPQRNTGFNNFSSQGVSMRQAMLNETKHMGNTTNHATNNAPGYSLFNTTTSWAPMFPGQLRSGANPDNRQQQQQSLFTGPAPQSLQQLLEQQNQFQKGDT